MLGTSRPRNRACHDPALLPYPRRPTRGAAPLMAGLPLDAWALLVVAVGLGLSLEVAFRRARRHDRDGDG